MGKITFPKPGNFIYPVPAVLVSCRGKNGETNLITVAWTGTVCSTPPMAYISVRKERASYELLKESGEFVINLPSRAMTWALDYCGCTSMRKENKWEKMGLHEGKSKFLSAPTVEEAPISIECRVSQVLPLGSHDLFLAEVLAVQVDEKYLDEKGSFHMEEVDLVAYSHGEYYALGELLGSFGYSVRKKEKAKPENGKKSPLRGEKDFAEKKIKTESGEKEAKRFKDGRDKRKKEIAAKRDLMKEKSMKDKGKIRDGKRTDKLAGKGSEEKINHRGHEWRSGKLGQEKDSRR